MLVVGHRQHTGILKPSQQSTQLSLQKQLVLLLLGHGLPQENSC